MKWYSYMTKQEKRNFQKVIDRAMIACELSPVTISKMSRGELICIDVYIVSELSWMLIFVI